MDMGISEKVISSDGTPIAFYRSGSGSPLLFVHGTTADHQRWDPILPKFEQHLTVYTMDRRGRGGSGDSPDYDIMREAEDVAAVVEAIYQQSGEPVSVLGHSYGGLCSLEAALLTDKVSRLIIYEPAFPRVAPPIPPIIPDRIQALVEKGELEDALVLFFREVVGMPEHELGAYRQLPVWKTRIQLAPTIPRELAFDRSYRFDAGKYANLQVPTLLLLGGDSPTFAKQSIEMVNSALPDSRVAILPDQRHIAMDTNPDLFVREVLQFLEAE